MAVSGYRIEPLGRDQLALAAGQEVARRRHLMYGLIEVDLTAPRRLMREHREATGERLSLTAYVVACLARALAENPRLNALRRRRSLVILHEIIVEVLIEGTTPGSPGVRYLPVRHADARSVSDITAEIERARGRPDEVIPDQRWLRHVPTWCWPWIMNSLSRSVKWALRLGVAGVNNVGVGADAGGWGLSPGAGTLAVTLGGISRRLRPVDGRPVEVEIGQLTLSFDHDVINGAPAARFTSRFAELLSTGEVLHGPDAGPSAPGE